MTVLRLIKRFLCPVVAGQTQAEDLLEVQGCLNAQPMQVCFAKSGDPETWDGDIFMDAPEDVDFITPLFPDPVGLHR